MTDTPNDPTEPTTMIANLRTGGRPMTWGERAKGVQERLDRIKQDIQEILGDESIPSVKITQACARVSDAVGSVGATVDMLASVCETMSPPPERVPDVAGLHNDLAAIVSRADMILRYLRHGELTESFCLDWTSTIKDAVKRIRQTHGREA